MVNKVTKLTNFLNFQDFSDENFSNTHEKRSKPLDLNDEPSECWLPDLQDQKLPNFDLFKCFFNNNSQKLSSYLALLKIKSLKCQSIQHD